MKSPRRFHPLKISLLGLLIASSALGSVWYAVKNKAQTRQIKREEIRKDSIETSEVSKKQGVDIVYENLLGAEDRIKLLDTLLNQGELTQNKKNQLLMDLKDQNAALNLLQCDFGPEDSVRIDQLSLQDFPLEIEKSESDLNLPESNLAKNFSAHWVKSGKVKSKKQIEISFEYLQSHSEDSLPIFVLVKDGSGRYLDHIKKCFLKPFSNRSTDNQSDNKLKYGKKIRFRAGLKRSPESGVPKEIIVYHSSEGYIGHANLK